MGASQILVGAATNPHRAVGVAADALPELRAALRHRCLTDRRRPHAKTWELDLHPLLELDVGGQCFVDDLSGFRHDAHRAVDPETEAAAPSSMHAADGRKYLVGLPLHITSQQYDASVNWKNAV